MDSGRRRIDRGDIAARARPALDLAASEDQLAARDVSGLFDQDSIASKDFPELV